MFCGPGRAGDQTHAVDADDDARGANVKWGGAGGEAAGYSHPRETCFLRQVLRECRFCACQRSGERDPGPVIHFNRALNETRRHNIFSLRARERDVKKIINFQVPAAVAVFSGEISRARLRFLLKLYTPTCAALRTHRAYKYEIG